jgi:asparaginyl-tRNA synthetase
MAYLQIHSALSDSKKGKKVNIRGWVHRIRKQKQLIFLVIRDSSDVIQAIIEKPKVSDKVWKGAQKLTLESSLTLTGKVSKEPRAPTGYELKVSNIAIIDVADVFPITRDKSTEFLMDVRHLWIRSREITETLKVRSAVLAGTHDYFRSKNYYEFQSPNFSPTKGEGGSEVFEVPYFGRKAYLPQTWQLYAEAGVYALEKIYCIAPSFRAEKSFTSRHLTEYWHAETETAWQTFGELQKQVEEMISHVCQYVAKHAASSLKFLGKDPKDLKKIKPPFPKIKYAAAIKLLKKNGFPNLKYGTDIGTPEEKKLAELYDKPLLVTHYPISIKAFYVKKDSKNPKESECFDVMCKGVGEIISASVRESDEKELTKRLKQAGEKLKDYKFYIDLRKYGSVPHAGFGLGIERFIMYLAGISHIRDTIPFPRTPNRISP